MSSLKKVLDDAAVRQTMKPYVSDVMKELCTAMVKYSPMTSAHDGWAVLYEEVDELWDEVKVKQGQRSRDKLYSEAIQVAAMALRFAHDIAKGEKQP